jgi:hypothetical protein
LLLLQSFEISKICGDIPWPIGFFVNRFYS